MCVCTQCSCDSILCHWFQLDSDKAVATSSSAVQERAESKQSGRIESVVAFSIWFKNVPPHLSVFPPWYLSQSKQKRIKERYGDQDEEERLARMEILAVSLFGVWGSLRTGRSSDCCARFSLTWAVCWCFQGREENQEKQEEGPYKNHQPQGQVSPEGK